MHLSIEHPVWLWLFAAAPWFATMARRSISGIGPRRAAIALFLRLTVFAAIVLSLAGVRLNRESRSVNVAYLLDQSESIPEAHRAAMRQLVSESVERHRRGDSGDLAAVVVFGRAAAIEYPPVDYTPVLSRIESPVDTTATDISDALRVANRLLPHDAPRRVVVVSDGNENLGAAVREAAVTADDGMSIDVIAAPVDRTPDVAVESVAVPTSAKRGQPYDVRVVLNSRGADQRVQSGLLRVTRKSGDAETTIAETPVTLPPGKSVFKLRQQPDDSDFFVYEARFVPDSPGRDRTMRNNVASGFVDLRGPGRVLVIEDHEHPGEFDALVERLRSQRIDVDLRPCDRAFGTLADLQRYDSVVLANVPRTSGDPDSLYGTLSDEQIEALVDNTEQLGCGLVMLGGARAFGAGGWADTPLEEAMPVDFRIKSAKVIPSGALALVIDKSGSMQGRKLALARDAAIEAIRVLGPRDYVAVVAFDDAAHTIVPLSRVGEGMRPAARVDLLGAGGGTSLYPGMEAGLLELRKATDAAVKHMIVLTDGQTPAADHERLAQTMRDAGITVTGVAVGPDADRQLLSRIALRGGGKFYAVQNAQAVPSIFMREARRVAMPVIQRLAPPRSPARVVEHEILSGVSGPFPPLEGFVQTTVKDSALVDVVLRSPVPVLEQNATILATWTYGLGRTAAFTTDAGHDWANAWTGWEQYDQFLTQLIRWSIRPTGEESGFSLATQQHGLRTRVVVDALETGPDAVVPVAMSGYAVGANGESIAIPLEPVAPGRYVGEFDSSTAGSYFLTVFPPGGGPALRAGVNVSNTQEYRDDSVNAPLLESLVGSTPISGEAGRFVGAAEPLPFVQAEGDEAARELDPFRRDQPPVIRSREAWPWFVLVACGLFLGDITIRRVAVDPPAMKRALRALMLRREPETLSPTIARLRSRRQALRDAMEPRERSLPGSPLDELRDPPATPPEVTPPREPEEQNENPLPSGYTARLLAAKRAATEKPRHD